eukprot:6065206-Karenia_brevis.AAC.1
MALPHWFQAKCELLATMSLRWQWALQSDSKTYMLPSEAAAKTNYKIYVLPSEAVVATTSSTTMTSTLNDSKTYVLPCGVAKNNFGPYVLSSQAAAEPRNAK